MSNMTVVSGVDLIRTSSIGSPYGTTGRAFAIAAAEGHGYLGAFGPVLAGDETDWAGLSSLDVGFLTGYVETAAQGAVQQTWKDRVLARLRARQSFANVFTDTGLVMANSGGSPFGADDCSGNPQTYTGTSYPVLLFPRQSSGATSFCAIYFIQNIGLQRLLTEVLLDPATLTWVPGSFTEQDISSLDNTAALSVLNSLKNQVDSALPDLVAGDLTDDFVFVIEDTTTPITNYGTTFNSCLSAIPNSPAIPQNVGIYAPDFFLSTVSFTITEAKPADNLIVRGYMNPGVAPALSVYSDFQLVLIKTRALAPPPVENQTAPRFKSPPTQPVSRLVRVSIKS